MLQHSSKNFVLFSACFLQWEIIFKVCQTLNMRKTKKKKIIVGASDSSQNNLSNKSEIPKPWHEKYKKEISTSKWVTRYQPNHQIILYHKRGWHLTTKTYKTPFPRDHHKKYHPVSQIVKTLRLRRLF